MDVQFLTFREPLWLLTVSRRIRQRAYLPMDFDCRVFHVFFLFPWQTVLVCVCVHFSFKTINNRPTANTQQNGWHFALIFIQPAQKGRNSFIQISSVWEKEETPVIHIVLHPSVGRADEIRKSHKNFVFFFSPFLLCWTLLAHVSSPAANFYLLLSPLTS